MSKRPTVAELSARLDAQDARLGRIELAVARVETWAFRAFVAVALGAGTTAAGTAAAHALNAVQTATTDLGAP